MAENDLTTYLAENPRMIGVLFTIVLLLTQAGNAAGAVQLALMEPKTGSVHRRIELKKAAPFHCISFISNA